MISAAAAGGGSVIRKDTQQVKKKAKRIALLCAIAVIIGVGFVLWRNSYLLFILGENIGVNCDKIEMRAVYPDGMKSCSLDELSSDERVRFEQSAMLVNEEYPLGDGFIPYVSGYKDTDVQMNECMVKAYERLSQAVSGETGERLFVASAYRTQEEQRTLYEEDPSAANAPGASEHQTGLGLDVYAPYYAGFGFIKTEAGQFVNSECWKYGFIIRYPSCGKTKTGMKYEPWHIRYVGEPHAKIIYNNHLTLEEYIESLENGAWYEADHCLISRQRADESGSLSLPDSFTRR